ncbi:hypothetical protein TUBRATIS_12230 [Tubulinosema ratisbonensis]|uniref:Uncharacterized protein n=1 Tax=Tubulinosema ratisbonensis TaxID=291195 RepID=A0A437AMF2_9MICR|nr:hypothetical protein TUBRATIS_12230 [Tubulinosema ratisbonensis]
MQLLVLLTFFKSFISTGTPIFTDAELNDIKKNFTIEIKKFTNEKNLEGLVEFNKTMLLMCNDLFAKNPLEKQHKHQVDNSFVWIYSESQKYLKKVYLHFKKNNPNDSYYQEYKENIQLFLNNLKINSISNLFYYSVHCLVFLGGFIFTILVFYLVRKK